MSKPNLSDNLIAVNQERLITRVEALLGMVVEMEFQS